MACQVNTCALIWWTLDPDKLSEKALKACMKVEWDGGFISSISIWEVGIKIKNKKLDIGHSIEQYVRNIHKLGYLEIIPVDETIWVKNLALDWKNKDPADRTIVASAKYYNHSLVTSDKIIRRFYNKTIW